MPAVGNVLATIERRDWSRLESLLDPEVHWTTAIEEHRHGPGDVIALLKEDPPPAPPAYHEVRDGLIVALDRHSRLSPPTYACGAKRCLGQSGRRVSNPRPRAWEARALPTELRPRSGRFYGQEAPGSNLPGPVSARSLIAFLAVCAVVGLLAFGLLSKGSATHRGRRPGPRQGAAGARRHGQGEDRRLPRRMGAGQPLGLLVPAVPPGGAGPGALLEEQPRSRNRRARDQRPGQRRGRARLPRRIRRDLPGAALGRGRAQRSLRRDRRARELPRRPEGKAGPDLAPAGRRADPARAVPAAHRKGNDEAPGAARGARHRCARGRGDRPPSRPAPRLR